MKRPNLLLLLLIGCALVVHAQNAIDSLTIVTTNWKTTPMGKGILCKEADFPSLYGVPQHIVFLEIDPECHLFDVLQHNGREKTSEVAHRSNSVAAINGSYFNMRVGNSVCYLQKDGVLIDTTAVGGLSAITNGAILIKEGRIELIPWKVEEEANCTYEQTTILASGPMMLLDGEPCNFFNIGHVTVKHPRSAVAIMEDGKVLFIAVDGRFKGQAEGINIPELAHLIRVLGGKEALNLDGGGSTVLWSTAALDNGVVNKPCDNKIYDNRGERAVANSLCVYE